MLKMALDNFHRRAQSIGLLRLSSIPETQGNTSWVGTTNLDGSPSSLTQSSEAPFITPDVMNFNSLFCDSIKRTSSATTCKGTGHFQLVYDPMVVISVVHQISTFHLLRAGYYVLTPLMLDEVM